MSGHAEKRPGRPYRSRDGILFGVCAGLADYFDVNRTGLRLLLIIGFFVSGFWPVGIGYIIAALVMKLAPAVPFDSEDDAEFYNSYAGSRSMALHRLKRTFDSLDRRIQRMESIVTSSDYDWDRRLNGEKDGV
jgi:phage shock protein C